MNIFFWIFPFLIEAIVSATTLSPFFNVDRIVGGYPVEIEDYPYQVLVRERGIPLNLCGGSIYSETIIITAAHCFESTPPERLDVTAGTKYLNGKDGITVGVKKIIFHENYNSMTAEYDIALLVLDDGLPLNNNTIKAVELAETDPKDCEMATASGWGQQEQQGIFPSVLYAVQIPIVNKEACIKAYEFRNIITDSMLCAGELGRKDSCVADSGGPLVVNNTLVGVISWGKDCASPVYPGVYARVSYLRSWILKNSDSLDSNFI